MLDERAKESQRFLDEYRTAVSCPELFPDGRAQEIANQLKKFAESNAAPKHYAELLHRRYIQKQSLQQIAMEMNYNFDHLRHLHSNALILFHPYAFLPSAYSKKGDDHIASQETHRQENRPQVLS